MEKKINVILFLVLREYPLEYEKVNLITFETKTRKYYFFDTSAL